MRNDDERISSIWPVAVVFVGLCWLTGKPLMRWGKKQRSLLIFPYHPSCHLLIGVCCRDDDIFLGAKMIHRLKSELVICFARWTGVDMQPLHTLNALQSLSTKAALPVDALQMCEYKYKDSSVFVMMEARCLLPPKCIANIQIQRQPCICFHTEARQWMWFISPLQQHDVYCGDPLGWKQVIHCSLTAINTDSHTWCLSILVHRHITKACKKYTK